MLIRIYNILQNNKNSLIQFHRSFLHSQPVRKRSNDYISDLIPLFLLTNP